MSYFTEPEIASQYARARWEEGALRLERHATDSLRRVRLEEVVDGILRELEKRVGQVFSTLDLAQAQDRAESWCLEIAHQLAPDEPYAWELDIVQNAAFHRYARRATDYQLNLGQE